MKRTALAGLFVSAAMLASPVFANEPAKDDLCAINLQKINDAMATSGQTSENTSDDIKTGIEKAKSEQAKGQSGLHRHHHTIAQAYPGHQQGRQKQLSLEIGLLRQIGVDSASLLVMHSKHRGRLGFDAGCETLGACRVGNRTRKSTVATFYSCQ